MTFRKYHVIVCFIILLYVVVGNVVIAQEPEDTPSPTVNEITITSTESKPTHVSHKENKEDKETTIKSCTAPDSACRNVNDTLRLCNGVMVTPDKYIEKDIHNGTYQPDSFSLARCMCNQPYYNMLEACVECFVNTTGKEFEVAPLEQYENRCKSFGVTYTQETPPPPTTGIPSKVKLILSIGLFVVSFGLLGMLLYKLYKRKKRRESERAFAEKLSADLVASSNRGRLSTGDTLTKTYPAPSSTPTHHRTPPRNTPPSSGGPPPPSSNISLPSPQPYYPPGSQGGGQGGGQSGQSGQSGGQSDSYFNNSF